MGKSFCILPLLFATLFLTALRSEAAAWRVNGRVVDAEGAALPGVIVRLNDANGSTVAFCSTNSRGEFTLSRQQTPEPKWTTSFAFLGYETRSISAGELREGMTVRLEEAPLELKEVIVRIPPIKSIGDTLTYDVASFRSASDRNIEDVIKKLPGVEVSEEGRIYYNGESINRFYIEGLDVVTGRYTLATRNISPDDILSINVYENHQLKRVLKDIAFSEKAALNLKMKKKSMLKPVGHITGGGGADNDGEVKWLGELFGMFIAPGKQMLVTGKGNNSGNSYTGETRNLITEKSTTESVASGLFPSTPFGDAKIPAERYFDNRSATASINTVGKFGPYCKLGITADYTDEDNRITNTESISYSNGEGGIIGFDERINSNPHSGEAKFSVSVENNAPAGFISDKLSFRGSFADNRYKIQGTATGSDVAQQSRTDDYSFTNNLDGTVRNGGKVISFSSDIAVVNTPVSRLSATDGPAAILSQRGRALGFTTDEKAGYSWMCGEYSHIGGKLRFESAYDTFKSDFATESSGTAGNDLSAHKLKATIEPEYQYKPDSRYWLNIKVPVEYTSIKIHDRLTGGRYPTDRVDVGFKAAFHVKPSANFRGSLSLARQTALGGVRDYIVNPVYTTYRQRITFGTGQLNERGSYSAATNLFYRDPIKAFFATLTALYRIGHNNRISGNDVTPGQVSSSVENSDNRSDMLNTGLSLSKNFRSWRTTFVFDANIDYLRREVLRQKKAYVVNNLSYILHASVQSNPIAEALDFSIDAWYRPSVQKITSLGLRNRVDDIEAQAKLSVHPIKSVEIHSQVYCNRTSLIDNTKKSCFFLGAGIRLHAGRFDIELNGKNLTNSKVYSYSYLVDSDLYSHTFTLRPIEILASVKYTF